jgi:hypothetical protein
MGCPVEKRVEIVDRLVEVAETREVVVMTKDGPVAIDGPADDHAIRAIRVLVAMDRINQINYWNQVKKDRLNSGKGTSDAAIKPVILQQPISPEIAKRLTGG